MAVTDQHPQYAAVKKSWQLMRDSSSVAGEETIKEATTKYLPKSAGQIEAEKQSPLGKEIYNGYLQRAQYPLWVQDSLRTMIGLVSKLTPEIQIKSNLMKHLEENATNDGFGLKQLFIRIVEQIIEFGRCGLYIDVDGDGKPYFALYDALSIINWKENSVEGRKDTTLVVLEEQHSSGEDKFSHNTKTVQRSLELNDGNFEVFLHDGGKTEEKTPKIGNNSLGLGD